MKDFTGKELYIGDEVVAVWVEKSTLCMQTCEIIGFTPKMVKLKYTTDYNKDDETLRKPRNLIKL